MESPTSIQTATVEASDNRRYKSPSILEAVFELRFESIQSWGISSFVEFTRIAKERGYPILKDVNESFQFKLSHPAAGLAPEVSAVASRVQTWNEEGTQLWQASPEMFAANRRAPYLGWKNFRPHIFEGLDIFRGVAN